jgi:hypothetical protein
MQNQNKHEEEPSNSLGETRRSFLKKPLMLAAGSVVMPSFLGSLLANAKADGHGHDLSIARRYYPLKHFHPQINLTGKLAVITGASRGNGRAIGEALAALGVDVIGTSRDRLASRILRRIRCWLWILLIQRRSTLLLQRSKAIHYSSSTAELTSWSTTPGGLFWAK